MSNKFALSVIVDYARKKVNSIAVVDAGLLKTMRFRHFSRNKPEFISFLPVFLNLNGSVFVGLLLSRGFSVGGRLSR